MKNLLFVFLLIFVSSAYAQDVKNYIDPNKRPKLWDAIQKAPTDSLLWIYYTDKTWEEMNFEEQHHVLEIKQILMMRALCQHTNIINFDCGDMHDHQILESIFIDETAYVDLMNEVESVKIEVKKKKKKKQKIKN